MSSHKKNNEPRLPFKERGLVPVIILTLVCSVCVAMLSVTATITSDARARQAQLMADANKRALFPEADEYPAEALEEAGKSFPSQRAVDLTADYPSIDQLFVVRKGGEVVGAILRASSKGYGGKVPVMVGFDLEGKIVGIVPDASGETAGLGQNVSRSQFTNQFKDRALTDPLTDIDMVSSATISSKSVISSVKAAAEAFSAFMRIEGGK